MQNGRIPFPSKSIVAPSPLWYGNPVPNLGELGKKSDFTLNCFLLKCLPTISRGPTICVKQQKSWRFVWEQATRLAPSGRGQEMTNSRKKVLFAFVPTRLGWVCTTVHFSTALHFAIFWQIENYFISRERKHAFIANWHRMDVENADAKGDITNRAGHRCTWGTAFSQGSTRNMIKMYLSICFY